MAGQAAAIREVLRHAPDGMTTAEIRAATGLGSRTISRALTSMIHQGTVKRRLVSPLTYKQAGRSVQRMWGNVYIHVREPMQAPREGW